MQLLKSKTLYDVHDLSLQITRYSCFAFFSTNINAKNIIIYKRNKIDYVLFLIGMIVSIMGLMQMNAAVFSMNLKSTVLSLGVILQIRAINVLILVTRIFNLVTSQKLYKYFVDMKWIDDKVRKLIT